MPGINNASFLRKVADILAGALPSLMQVVLNEIHDLCAPDPVSVQHAIERRVPRIPTFIIPHRKISRHL
jgi:hypothetical protein